MSKPEILSESMSEAAHADAELDASLNRVSLGIDRLADQRDRYARALHDILEMAEEREDVLDGPDGQPRPDTWMQVATLARTALEGK